LLATVGAALLTLYRLFNFTGCLVAMHRRRLV
jgi:hypothetical protein